MTEVMPSTVPSEEGSFPSSDGKGPSILVISINYPPEPSGFDPHVAAYCEHLASRGFDVTVLTGYPFAPYWKRSQEYEGQFRTIEQRGGVRVIRHAHYIPTSPRRLAERLLMEATFCLHAILSVFRTRKRCDLVIYVGAQPCLAMLARGVAWLAQVPYGVNINDIASEAARDVGIVGKGTLLRMMRWFEFTAYRGAGGGVVLCRAFKELLEKEKCCRGNIAIVRSPIDIETVGPQAVPADLRKKLGIFEGDFVVMFSGSMGIKQGMENVVQAARIAANRGSRAKWLLIGDGEVRQRVEAMISELGLKGTVFRIPFQPVDLVGPTLNAAQVLLLNQLASVKDTVIPSKLLTYMAAGRAVLAAVNPNSQGAEILRESGGGVLVAPGDPVALAEGILSLENDLGKLGVMGTANRAYAVEHFDQRRILSELESFTRGLLAPLHRVQGTPGAANPT